MNPTGTDIALEQEAGRDPLCTISFCEIALELVEVILQCEKLQGYAMRGALSVKFESLSHKMVRAMVCSQRYIMRVLRPLD
jgi:hypothetical protein